MHEEPSSSTPSSPRSRGADLSPVHWRPVSPSRCSRFRRTRSPPTEGLEAGEVKIPVGEMEIPAYRAMPDKGGPFPVVLVVQEIFGVHEHIKDVCRRFAKLGYLAIAPELYARQGDVSKLNDIQDIITKVVSKVPDAQVMSDLDATVAWAKKSGKGDTAKLGITGFCWGGRIVWLYAAHNKDLKAGVAWYGRLVGRNPTNCIRRIRSIWSQTSRRRCSACTAARTRAFRSNPSTRCERRSRTPRKTAEIIVYPTRRTASTPIIVRAIARKKPKDGWKRLLEWFKKNGVA